MGCSYCSKERGVPCMNTRDMEEAAIAGDRECFFQLAKLGGGEMGLTRVIRRAEGPQDDLPA